ncbi:MAG: tetratricopeptide repeat protein [Planctomycetota bacterium]
MDPTSSGIDIDRALDAALADVGEAQQLRRRAPSEVGLRRSLRALADEHVTPGEVDPMEAARRAAALFILGRDTDVGSFAARADSHRVLYLWGLSELYRDRPHSALTAFKRSLDKEPRDEQARLQLACTLALTGDSDSARDTLGDLSDDTDRPQVLHVLGAIAESEGDYAGAQDRYQEALAQEPEHIDSLFRLAYQHDLSGDDDAAITLYERARHVRPTRANILVNLGVLYEDRGEYEKAADCYRQVLARYPNHARAKPFLRDAESSQSMVLDVDTDRKEDRRNQLLRTPISDFELSVRSRNCLAKMHISSLGDLIQRSEAELLSYKNFGETSLQEIKDILNAKGLRLGMRREEVLIAEAAASAPAMPTLPDIPGAAPVENSEAYGLPITDLDLSVRSSKCMSLLTVQTIGDLINYSENDLLKTKNFGVTSLQEIKTKLASMGLSLKKS